MVHRMMPIIMHPTMHLIRPNVTQTIMHIIMRMTMPIIMPMFTHSIMHNILNTIMQNEYASYDASYYANH